MPNLKERARKEKPEEFAFFRKKPDRLLKNKRITAIESPFEGEIFVRAHFARKAASSRGFWDYFCF